MLNIKEFVTCFLRLNKNATKFNESYKTQMKRFTRFIKAIRPRTSSISSTFLFKYINTLMTIKTTKLMYKTILQKYLLTSKFWMK